MNIYIELNKIIDYIEDNLEEKIESKELSKMVGLNDYTFQKIFSIICNVSLSEYIRKRRLSNAGQELFLGNEKVIDIAFKYQYNNATAFSRAFEKFHGIKPSMVSKNPDKLKMYTKLHLNENYQQSKNVEYKIVDKDELVLYGKYKITTNDEIGKDAPIFFEEIESEYGIAQYGMVEYKDKERFFVKSYWVLYDKKQKGLEKKIIPKSRWILIKIDSQEAQDIQKLSKIFYYDFLPSCKYNLKELPELEYYHDGITEFLIPIED